MSHLVQYDSDSSEEWDFDKAFQQKTVKPGRQGREINERVRNLRLWNEVENEPDAFNGSQSSRYFVKYQAIERQRMAAAVQPHFKASGVERQILQSAMSEIESDTIGASSICGQSIITNEPKENLQAKFRMEGGNVDNGLPVNNCRKDILERIEAFPVTIISGSTGCGKSTQVPQFILDHHVKANRYVNIIVTQPRRLAAQALAKRVCNERNWHLGGLVGYKVGLDKCNASKDTRLLYVTTGVLIKMLIGKKRMDEWTHIVIDEVHERDKDMDFLFLLTRKFLTSNSQNVKIILMSATMNPEKLQAYYSWPIYVHGPVCRQSEHFNIPGSLGHSVGIFYLDTIITNRQNFKGPTERPALMESCITECRRIIFEGFKKMDYDKKEKGAVLVFLPGEMEIKDVLRHFKKFDPDNDERLVLLPLYSRLPFNEAQKIFEPVKHHYRKVILSTNMAESSVTIPDIAYVVDFCLTKKLIADPNTNYASLHLAWADKNSCDQRRGRAGRVRSGRVYRLVFKDFYERVLLNEHDPEMRRAPLDKLILDTKCLGMGSPKELLALALDPPDLRNITRTVLNLKDMGALLPTVTETDPSSGMTKRDYVEDDGDLTVLGEILAHMPIDTRLGKLVIYGYLFDIFEECLIIAAGLSGKSIFAFPFDKKLSAYANKLSWSNESFSDCIATLIAYQRWKDHVQTGHFKRNHVNESEWCRQRFLQQKSLREMDVTIEDIKKSLDQYNIRTLHLPNREDRIRRKASDNDYLILKIAIFGAFYPNYFFRSHGSLDMRDVYRQVNNYDPNYTLYLTGFPPDQSSLSDLYINQIKDLFRETQPSKSEIDVQVDCGKVIVRFKPPSRLELAGYPDMRIGSSISRHVYVGMKLKYSKDLKLMVYNGEEAKKLWTQHVEALQKIGSASTEDSIATYQSIGQVDLPRLEVSETVFMVTHIDNPNSFWVQYYDPKHKRMLEDVQDAIEAYIEFVKEEKIVRAFVTRLGQVHEDHVYLAPFEGVYYRARVDLIERMTAHVFFVDFGNVEEVNIQELVMITKQGLQDIGESVMHLIKIPSLAMKCSLTYIRPNSILTDRAWHSNAVEFFRGLIPQSGKVFADIFAVTPGSRDSVISVTLYGSKDKKEGSFNQMVLNEADDKNRHYAERQEESFPARDNNRLRKDEAMCNPEHKRKMEALQKACPSEASQDLGVKLEKKGEVECVLRGPYHPLEFSLTSAHQIGSKRLIRVEPESVNSVLLDTQPEDAKDQYFVAAQVHLTPSGQSLMARGTTFMPNKLGLGAILTMVFAPKVEMRLDNSGLRFTGCLAGLGHHEKCLERHFSGPPPGLTAFNPEHDMEIRFDAHIENEDIQQINRLRFYLMSALSRIPESKRHGEDYEDARRRVAFKISVESSIVEYQDKIRECMDNLIFKERQPKSREMVPSEYKWGQLKRKAVELDRVELDDSEYFLKMIDGVKFEEANILAGAENIIAGLKKMRRLASASTFLQSHQEAECPICPNFLVFSSPQEASNHLKDPAHLKHIADLREKVLQSP